MTSFLICWLAPRPTIDRPALVSEGFHARPATEPEMLSPPEAARPSPVFRYPAAKSTALFRARGHAPEGHRVRRLAAQTSAGFRPAPGRANPADRGWPR